MAKVKTKRIGISIDMTPLVDVAFLLLIFFMTTTQFQPPEKDKITLPASSSDVKKPESHIITINVTEQSRLRIEYTKNREKKDQYVEIEDLANWLQDARYTDPAAFVLLKADRNAPFGTVQKIMDVLQDQEANRFNIVTELKKKTSAAGG